MAAAPKEEVEREREVRTRGQARDKESEKQEKEGKVDGREKVRKRQGNRPLPSLSVPSLLV